jgi:predicted CXXCH cytochrome family protein
MKQRHKKSSLVFILVVPAVILSALTVYAQTNSCIACHREMGDELAMPAEAFKLDVHQEFGLSCSDCHGGNPAEEDVDLAKDGTFEGAPLREQIPEFCASCHSDSSYMRRYNPSLRVDQLDLYLTSGHGKLIKEGDTKAAVCTDCHGTHGILASSHPKSWTFPWNIPDMCGRCHADKDFMKGYRIPTNQLEEYEQSVHAYALFEKKDLSAPVCNDCHGNHGAAPPEVTSIAFVCRQCHPSTGELFSKSPHKTAYDELGISECEACHGNHKIFPPSDDMLGTGEKAVCIECHDPDSKPYQIASRMKKMLDDFIQQTDSARDLLEQANGKGVDVSNPMFKLREANTLLIMVRNLTHSLDIPAIEEKIQEGEKVILEVQEAGQAALKEATFRRRGLIISTFFVFLLAIALYLKIRLIEKKNQAK